MYVHHAFLLSVDRLFKEAGVQGRGQVRGEDVLKVLLTPLPDY